MGAYAYKMIWFFLTENNSLESYMKLCEEFKIENEFRLTYPFLFETEDIV